MVNKSLSTTLKVTIVFVVDVFVGFNADVVGLLNVADLFSCC